MSDKERIEHNSDWLVKTIEEFVVWLSIPREIEPLDYIVFRCGTAVALQPDGCCHTPFTEAGFLEPDVDSFLESDFPEHRFQDLTYEQLRADNQKDFLWSQATAFPEQCRAAYGCLMCGYPLPGGPGADRDVVPLTKDLWGTIFRELDDYCGITLLHMPGARRAQADNAEARRLDYMFPKPFAFIDKHLQVQILKPLDKS